MDPVQSDRYKISEDIFLITDIFKNRSLRPTALIPWAQAACTGKTAKAKQ